MNLNDFRNELLGDPEFKKEYEKYDLAFEISQMIIDARIKKGLTQERLAKLIGTKQSGIARMEKGHKLPSLSFLSKIAKAFQATLIVKLKFQEEQVKISSDSEKYDNNISNSQEFFNPNGKHVYSYSINN